MKRSKTIFKLLVILSLSMALMSCSKDDDGGPNPNPQTLLSKIITSNETITYAYDNANRAIGFNVAFPNPVNNYSASYFYDGSGVLTEVLYDTASTAEDIKNVYFHNSSGQITKIESYQVNAGVATLNYKSEAIYTTPGKVSVYQTPNGGAPYLNVDYFLDANGNTIRQLSYSPEGFLIVTTENSDYDDKHASSLSLPQTGFVRNVNNYRTVTVTTTGGSPSSGTYVYEYNNEGYPTKRTTNTGSIVTYEYIQR